jgi:hypothetical protein
MGQVRFDIIDIKERIAFGKRLTPVERSFVLDCIYEATKPPPVELSADDLARDAMALSRKISLKLQPMLKGHPPQLQGAVLADLLAIFLAGHAPQIREEILKLHIEQMRPLIAVNENIIFGNRGHPSK